MPGSLNTSNSSFIPKRGPAKRSRPRSKKPIFLFTIITYTILCASLLASAGVFFYKGYLQDQLDQELSDLKEVIDSFETKDFARVSEFDALLKQATNRINHHASIVSVLDMVDDLTAGPVQIRALSIKRQADTGFMLGGLLQTSSYDAAMFQRRLFSTNRPGFTDVVVSDVQIRETAADGTQAAEPQNVVSFAVEITVPLREVRYDPQQARMIDTTSAATVVPTDNVIQTQSVDTLSASEEPTI